MKYILILCAVVALASCRKDDTKIYKTKIDTIGFHTVFDSTQVGEILHPGDTLFAHTVPTIQTSYDVKANTEEQWSYAWKHGDVWIMIACLVVFAAFMAWFIKRNNAGTVGAWSVGLLILVMLICFGILGTSLGWWDGFETWITKDLYDAYMKSDGNLHSFFKKVI